MRLSFKDVERIQEEFQKEYVFPSPWNTYVNMCGISFVGIQDKNARDEDTENFCISVGLRQPLPETLSLCQKFIRESEFSSKKSVKLSLPKHPTKTYWSLWVFFYLSGATS